MCGCLRACSFALHLHPIRASIRSLSAWCFSRIALRFLFFTTICCACHQYRPIIALIILTMFRLFSAQPVVKAALSPEKVCGILFIFSCPDGIVGFGSKRKSSLSLSLSPHTAVWQPVNRFFLYSLLNSAHWPNFWSKAQPLMDRRKSRLSGLQNARAPMSDLFDCKCRFLWNSESE